MKEKIRKSILKLDKWIEKNGWAGYDPYDIQELPLFLEKKPIFFRKIERKVISKIDGIYPLFIRKILGVRKKINAKAMGLFAQGYLNLFKTFKDKNYLDKAEQCFAWLKNNYSTGYSGYCWGYPFDWQSKMFIPKYTPSAVVSSVCGNAFWDFYQLEKEEKYLKICQSICKFFLTDLNIDQFGSDKICFSYTPIDNFHVHNANLFAAEFLIKVGKEVKSQKFIDYGLKAMNYAISEQNEDGSICYSGKGQEEICNLDHYHSGFEIRSLYSIWKLTGNEKVYKAISKYYRFYLNNFFESKTIPKIKPRKIYPINIHSCAEAILSNSLLSEDFPQAKEYLENASQWIIQNMQTRKGWFIFQIKKKQGIVLKIRIPYIRWGQAWMLNAFSHVLLKEKFYENYTNQSSLEK